MREPVWPGRECGPDRDCRATRAAGSWATGTTAGRQAGAWRYRGGSSPTSPRTPHRLPRTARRTMTSPPGPSPSGMPPPWPCRSQPWAARSASSFARLDKAALTGDLNLADQFAELARAVTQALDSPPRGPAAPYWIGLDPLTTPASSRNSGSGPTPSCAANTAATSCAAAGPTTRTPSGNCPSWPPNGTASTAATGTTWSGRRNPRPVAARHHAPNRRHHPPVQPRMRRPAAGAEGSPRTYALRSAAATGSGKDRHDHRQAHPG